MLRGIEAMGSEVDISLGGVEDCACSVLSGSVSWAIGRLFIFTPVESIAYHALVEPSRIRQDATRRMSSLAACIGTILRHVLQPGCIWMLPSFDYRTALCIA